MDKASIIKDAIDYIQELHEQERRIQAEILELESGKLQKGPGGYDFDQDLPAYLRSKKKRTDAFYDSGGSRISPIEVLEVNLSSPSSLSISQSLRCRPDWFQSWVLSRTRTIRLISCQAQWAVSIEIRIREFPPIEILVWIIIWLGGTTEEPNINKK